MLGILFELALSFIQFASVIILPLAPSDAGLIPGEWVSPVFYLSALSLDKSLVSSVIFSLDDTRIYFLTVCVAVPLFIGFIGLVFLNTFLVITWYLFSLASMVLLLVGTAPLVINESKWAIASASASKLMLYVGAGGVALSAVLVLMASRGCFGKLTPESDSKTNQKLVMATSTSRCDLATSLKMLLILLTSTLFGALFFWMQVTSYSEIQRRVPSGTLAAAGSLFALIAFFVFIFFVLSLFQRGREWSWKFKEFMKHTFLKILLLSLSMLYIPIGASTFTVFNCNTVSCPTGYRIPDQGMTVALNRTFGKCIPCHVVPGQMCPLDIQTSMCEGMTDDRLETDLFIGCEGMRNFFWPAGVLVVLFYILGVPLLFLFEIRTSTRLLMDDFPIKEPALEEGENANDFEQRRWELKVLMCDNSARFLFDAFEFKFRYMRLLQLIQKLVVVFTSVFVIRYGDLSPRFIVLGTSLGVHLVVAVVFVSFRPFLLNLHDWVAIALQAGLCLVIIIAVIVAAEVTLPSAVLTATMVLNFVLPGLSVLFSLIYFCFSMQREAEEAEAEMKRRAEVEAGVADDVHMDTISTTSKGHEFPAGKYAISVDPQPPKLKRSKSIAAKKREREKQRRIQIREKVRQQIQMEMDALKEQQMDSDVHIDQRMQKQLRIFLMAAGVLATVALGLCVLGLWSSQKPDVRTSLTKPMVSEHQIAGYASWSNFTSACCCASTESAYDWDSGKVAPLDVEIWVCQGGTIQERVRSYAYHNTTDATTRRVDGFDLRSMCGSSFSGGCEIVVGEGSAISLVCPQAVSNETKMLW